MWRKLCVLAVLLGIGVGTASAQPVDARKVLEASAKAMGADNVKAIQYTGSGWSSEFLRIVKPAS